jgi:hypothetical protein
MPNDNCFFRHHVIVVNHILCLIPNKYKKMTTKKNCGAKIWYFGSQLFQTAGDDLLLSSQYLLRSYKTICFGRKKWGILKDALVCHCLTPCSFEHISRISSYPAVFFFHNKSTNITFSHNKLAKRTGCKIFFRHHVIVVNHIICLIFFDRKKLWGRSLQW